MLATQSGFVIRISVGCIARMCARSSIESGARNTSNPSRGADGRTWNDGAVSIVSQS